MKKICVVLASVFLFFASNAFAAITISVYDTGTPADQTLIDNWKTNLGGIDEVLEDFQGTDTKWYQTLNSGVGEFKADGEYGLGGSSYKTLEDSNSTESYFRIHDELVYGRDPSDTGDNFLDSADITKLTLDVTPDLTNLWFYIQDPSDQGAITTITAKTDSFSDFYLFDTKQSDGAEFFVGISIDNDTLKQITWETSGTNFRKDGYGLDNFTTVSAVPLPGAALLLASGLLGMGWVKKRSKSFSD